MDPIKAMCRAVFLLEVSQLRHRMVIHEREYLDSEIKSVLRELHESHTPESDLEEQFEQFQKEAAE